MHVDHLSLYFLHSILYLNYPTFLLHNSTSATICFFFLSFPCGQHTFDNRVCSYLRSIPGCKYKMRQGNRYLNSKKKRRKWNTNQFAGKIFFVPMHIYIEIVSKPTEQNRMIEREKWTHLPFYRTMFSFQIDVSIHTHWWFASIATISFPSTYRARKWKKREEKDNSSLIDVWMKWITSWRD